jgi:hypothetical protein
VRKDDRSGTIITCAHLFRQGLGEVTVGFADGRRFQASLLGVDRAWDLAALAIPAPPAEAAPLAADYPRPGDALQSCGYGPDGRYRCNRGKALGYSRAAGSADYETLALSGSAREGDSGGPVFNARGELAAVLWGTDGRTVEATYCGRVRKFLAGLAAPRGDPVPSAPKTEPGPSAPSPVPPSAPPPAAADLADELRRRLETQEQSLGRRFERIENAVGLIAGLKERIEQAEGSLGAESLRAAVREAAGSIAAGAGPGWLQTLLPAVLTALGWSCPPSIAAVLALRLLAAFLQRRSRGRLPDPRTAAPILNDDYAAQLAQVYGLSGHSTLADATLGRSYDEELRQAEQSSDGVLAAWARRLRERVARRFYRIHGQSPSPAEPASQPSA